MRSSWIVVPFFLLACAGAQIIQVDITPGHVRKMFAPNQTLGAGIDRISQRAIDESFVKPVIDRVLEAGWGPVTYRQNTELYTEAWHWNPKGTWSDPSGKGYFVGDPSSSGMIRYSYGYPLPHRGVTRDDGTETVGYSRLTDGDLNTYWKSNPYLTKRFTGGGSDNPQWIFFDLSSPQMVDAIRIAWANPYARRYAVQFFTGDDPIRSPNNGVWQNFPFGVVTNGTGGAPTLKLASAPIAVRWVRIWMTESSDTCDSHGSGDSRNCVGYAIREIYMGTLGKEMTLRDLLRHTADQDQTPTYCSSVDPWHEPSDIDHSGRAQAGFDLFYTSGYTRGLPAMIPIALIYSTPEDAAAEIKYLENRHYPMSYVEMGEEPDGHYMLPEDYAALYVQFAAAIHKVDPALKLGGPIFTGQNKDIEVWVDGEGRTSWTGRFIDYLKAHGRLSDLAFFSFEHYPYDPCRYQWGSLYDEPQLVSHIMQVWREDGVPANVPLFITESNISSSASEASVDIFGALWLADYVGAFLTAGGDGLYYFHYIPLGVHPGCNRSDASFGMFSVDEKHRIAQPLAQFFSSQLINVEWLKPGGAPHEIYSAQGDIRDSLGNTLVTAYAVKRPDRQWALLIINKDQENAYKVRVQFHNDEIRSNRSFAGPVDSFTFGPAQYKWDPLRKVADPDGPVLSSRVNATNGTEFDLPAASIVVLRGNIAP
jgi:hypothetical protein